MRVCVSSPHVLSNVEYAQTQVRPKCDHRVVGCAAGQRSLGRAGRLWMAPPAPALNQPRDTSTSALLCKLEGSPVIFRKSTAYLSFHFFLIELTKDLYLPSSPEI